MIIEQILKDFIEDYTLALWALAFIPYTLVVRKVTAFNLVILLAIVLHVVHSNIRRSVKPLFGNPDYYSTIDLMWFGSFAATDIVFVFLCFFLIVRFGLARDRASNLLLIAYLILAALQLLTFLLRQFQIYSFDSIYSLSVISVNVAIAVIPLIMTLRVLIVRSGVVKLIRKEDV